MTLISTGCIRAFSIIFTALALIAGCGGGSGGESDGTAQTQYLVITIDVEASPAKQSEDHVERLIYGNFPGVGRAGIVDMMDIADRHQLKLTFFLDVLEEVLFPGQIEPVARLIVRRGHDLQLHTHSNIMPDTFFAKLGIPRRLSEDFTELEADALFNEIRSMVADWNVPPFIAYRAGGYRYGRGLVQALPKAGISFSYNYNIKGPSQLSYGIKNIPMFRWENDVVEIPVSYVDQSSLVFARFDDKQYLKTSNIQDSHDLIYKFQDQWPEPNVLIMMMHSWSFLHTKPGSAYFEYRSEAKAIMFDQFLTSLPKHVKVVSATELADLVTQGVVTVPHRMSTAEVFAN